MQYIPRHFFLAILLMAAMFTGMTGSVWAAEDYNGVREYNDEKKVVIMSIGSAQMIVDNDVIKIDAAPVIQNGRTYVPLRALSNIFDAKCQYNGDTKEIVIKKGSAVLVMPVGAADFTLNGEVKNMDAPAFITQNGRTMVPVRFLANAFGAVIKPTYNENGAVADLMLRL